MKIDESGQVTSFSREAQDPRSPGRRAAPTPTGWTRNGIKSRGRAYLASMGIYIFDRNVLLDMLDKGSASDFGKEVFPQALQRYRVQTHLFDGYWEDIGTIDAFHKANIDLALENPPFDFVGGDRPIYTRARFLPCSRICASTVDHSLIADGCVIGQGSLIVNSVIGVRSQIGENVTIRNSYIMGTDFYELTRQEQRRRPPLDRHRLGHRDRERHHRQELHASDATFASSTAPARHDLEETPFAMIRDGIVVVPKNTVIPSGTVL